MQWEWTPQLVIAIIGLIISLLTPLLLLWRKVERMEVKYDERLAYHEKDIHAVKQAIDEIKTDLTQVKQTTNETANDVGWLKQFLQNKLG